MIRLGSELGANYANSQYFKTWASAASSHDDERATKRLQTRQRYVNLAEERMDQKQQHCESELSS